MKHSVFCFDNANPTRGEAMARAFLGLTDDVFFSEDTRPLNEWIESENSYPKDIRLFLCHHNDFNLIKSLDELPLTVFYSGSDEDPPCQSYNWIYRGITSEETILTKAEAKEILEWLDDPSNVPSVFLPRFYPVGLETLCVLCLEHLTVHTNPETGRPDTDYDEQAITEAYKKMGLKDLLNGENKSFMEAAKLTDPKTRAAKQAEVSSAKRWADTFKNDDIVGLFQKEKQKLNPTAEDWEPIKSLLNKITNGTDIDCSTTAAAYLSICKVLS